MLRRFTFIAVAAIAACSHGQDSVTGPSASFSSKRCAGGDTLKLNALEAAHIDCSNGGATVVLTGGGAHYVVVPQFATGQASNTRVSYRIAASAASSAVANVGGGSAPATNAVLPSIAPNVLQRQADRYLRAQGRALAAQGAFRAVAARVAAVERVAGAVPAVGSTRSFKVRSSLTGSGSWQTIDAQLVYVGANILIYVDNASPAGGFSSTQLQEFGHYFDEVLYDIALGAFGAPSDIDQNGHVIMVMSPVVNADSPKATCATQGYIAGFFDTVDFSTSNANSNRGEVFYSIVPDPSGTVSCQHTVSELGTSIPSTFLHELQHIIFFSQHVVVSGQPSGGASWLDEGISIVAEELGSLYFEQKCPPPSCRTNPAQIFPDSAQGFVSNFLFDSYQYALHPDTASLTLHTDDQSGFSWRGGDWLLVRWLGDHASAGFYQRLERGPADGVADIEQAAGGGFGTLFANFGLSLYTDSLPGLPRSTVTADLRFLTRNVKQLWARLFTTAGPTSSIPRIDPLVLAPIGTTVSTASMVPGTSAYYRLDTPSNAATVTLLFAPASATTFPQNLKPQIAIFRLPAGQ